MRWTHINAIPQPLNCLLFQEVHVAEGTTRPELFSSSLRLIAPLKSSTMSLSVQLAGRQIDIFGSIGNTKSLSCGLIEYIQCRLWMFGACAVMHSSYMPRSMTLPRSTPIGTFDEESSTAQMLNWVPLLEVTWIVFYEYRWIVRMS